MERDQAQEKIVETLKEMKETLNYTAKPLKKVDHEKEFKKLKIIISGGDDETNLMKYPARRPQSFLDYVNCFPSATITTDVHLNRNHLLTTVNAKQIPKALCDAVRLKDTLHEVPFGENLHLKAKSMMHYGLDR